jgi:enoyl-CoA hydratase
VTDELVLVDEPLPRVRRLTLNRPEKRNALSNRLRTGLFDAMRSADADPGVSVIVIRGAGSCFSAGYDLAQDPAEPPQRHAAPVDVGWWSRHVVEGWFEMWDYATPTVAQIHGWCLAGGSELAAACDLAYAAADAQIGYPPVRLMSPPDMTWQPWLMGMRRAMEAVLTGDAMSGAEAAAAGVVNRSFPADRLEAEVLAVAERVSQVPADLLALSKRAVHRSMEAMGIRTGIRAATEVQALARHQPSSRAYFARVAEGVTRALDERDRGFGDYRTAPREPGDG